MRLTDVPAPVADRVDRLETALRELEHLAHQLVETHVGDDIWEQNRLLNEIHLIVNNGLK